ncbi:MAG: hypothetical protein WC529_08505 [Candidatus Margulisiibacteriota bacterium]
MNRKIVVLLLICLLGGGAVLAQPLTKKEIVRQKKELAKLEKEVNRLQNKLKVAKNKRLRVDIQDKLDLDRQKIKQIKNKLYPKKAKPPVKAAVPPVAPGSLETFASLEAGLEESVSSLEAGETGKIKIGGLRHEVGGYGGFFAGTTAFFGELRVPFRFIFGPATTSLRLSAGLAQSRETDRRFLPVNGDLMFNFPPGWFTGVENYLAVGLNYVAMTTGRKAGTVGGQVSYGIVSDGFGGIVFGELGYAILRTGFSPSHKGASVLVGYRKALF